MNKIFILSDLDGTLLDDKKNIPAKNISAINEFQKQNIFSVATGRHINSIKPAINGIKLNGPAIIFNGCMIYDFEKNEVLWQKELNCELTNRIIEYVLKTPKYSSMGILVYTKDSTYSLKDNYDLLWLIKIEGGGYLEKEEYTIKSPWLKVLFTGSNDLLHQLNDELISNNYLNNEIETSFSLDIFLELLPYGVNKGYALNKLKAMYKNYTFYCVGDYYNDYNMLLNADISVCPSNAPDDIKNICNYVLTDNNDGVIGDLISKIN